MKTAHRIAFFSVSAAVIAGSAFFAGRAVDMQRKPDRPTVAVSRADLHRDIGVTGTVKADVDVALAFERGGLVSAVYAKAGDKVKAGQVLATLGAADLAAQLAQAEAARAMAEARLSAVKRGARTEEVGVQDATLRGATAALDEARSGLVDKLQDAVAKADDAIRGKTDQFFTYPTGLTPHLSFFVPDQRLTDDLGLRRQLLGESLQAWQTAMAAVTPASDLDAAVNDSRAELDAVRGFLDDCAVALDKTTVATNPSLAQATLDGYKAGVSAARSNVLAASAALTAGGEKVRSAASAVDVAASQKTLKVAAPPAEDIAGQEAAVRQAAAAVDAARAQLGKVVLRAPVAGVLARQDAKVGATVTPGVPVATVMSDGLFTVEAIVPEADIADVKAGEDATVTLDAYGTGVPFTASVVSIDPVKSTADGITGYKVTLRFRDADERIKSGMIANVAIIAGTRTGALTVSSDAIIARDGETFVLVASDARGIDARERKVAVGLRGNDGRVEIVDGLAEGELVIGRGE
ncbi:MAG TPA: efflux RND transporter periplasmic adaptor subunit [Candidatus Binatia bacterium]|jgi:RND family efflux transporter MFP subunit|nr:efflux RND transporter periplasmic adaptor subunit [Candidatus Binatia bacterium]